MKIYKIAIFILLLCVQFISSQQTAAALTSRIIILYHNDGTNAVFFQSAIIVDEYTSVFPLPSEIPEREGYVFLGWSSQPTTTIPEHQPQDILLLSDELTELYAVWQPKDAFILVYNANGGENAPPAETGFSPTSSCKFKISIQKPQRTGYNFLGWSLDPNAEAAEYAGGGELRTSSRQTTLYAIWQAKPPVTFHLIYNANGGVGQPDTQHQKAPASGCTFSISNQQPKREGYIFLGWATAPQADNPEYQPGDELYTSARATNLYALWHPQLHIYTLIYDANGGSAAPEMQVKQTSDSYYTFTLSEQLPLRPDYEFLGWSQFADAKQADYQPGQALTITEPLKLYAIWRQQVIKPPEIIYTLAYHTNGGEDAPPTQVFITSERSHIFYISQQKPQRADYEFIGWSLNPNAAFAEYQPGDEFSTGSADNILYAVWHKIAKPQPQSYVLHYNANNGYNAPASQQIITANSICIFSIPEQQPLRTGYQFIGWSSRPDGNYAEYLPGEEFRTANTGNILYAVWRPEPKEYIFTLAYHANGGSSVPPSQAIRTAASSHSFQISGQQPKRSGYEFIGWSTQANANYAEYQPLATFTTTNLQNILYAVWRQKADRQQYTLIYNANGGLAAPPAQTAYGSSANCLLRLSERQPKRNGYQFLGWAFAAEAEQPNCFPGENMIINQKRLTLYAVWRLNEPAPPTHAYLQQLLGDQIIKLACLNAAAGHPEVSFPLLPKSYTCELAQTPDGNFTARLNIQPEPYLQAYNKCLKGHRLAGKPQATSIKLIYQAKYAAWLLANDCQPIVIPVSCAAPPQPQPADLPQILGNKLYVTVQCVEPDDSEKEHFPAFYGLLSDGWQIGAVQLDRQNIYTCRLSFFAQPYITAYNVSYGSHKLKPGAAATQEIILTYDPLSASWQSSDPTRPVFPVVYAPEPPQTIYNYSLRFEANGGSAAPYPQKASSLDESFLFVIPQEQPTRQNYNFLGWAQEPTAASPLYQPQDIIILQCDAPEMILYAVWQLDPNAPDLPPDDQPNPPDLPEIAYGIYYDALGGNYNPAEQIQYSREDSCTFEITAEQPQRRNYILVGWATTPNAEQAEYVAGDELKLTKNQPMITLYAVWTVKPPTEKPQTDPGADSFGSDDSLSINEEEETKPPIMLHQAYIQGYPDGTIQPNAQITNAEAATIFYRLYQQMDSAAKAPTAILNPQHILTRAEMVNMASKFYEVMQASNISNDISGNTPNDTSAKMPDTNLTFTDISQHWARQQIIQAAAFGWIKGYPDGRFAPDKPITRAESVSLLNRLLKRQPNAGNDAFVQIKNWPDNYATAWFYADLLEAGNSHVYTINNDTEIWLQLCAPDDENKLK